VRIAGRAARDGDGTLAGVLAAAGYEPVDDAGTLRLRNCPFDALVDEHRPLVCGTNLALAQGILEGLPGDGADYEPRLDAQPGYCCVVFKRDAAD
jgi:predicted ArsR family transcriptional regulator